MNTELYIENYRADITNEISALLNFAIDDIKDFSSRSTTWSRTIVLPGTASNNRLFGHIFQVGQSNNYNGSIPNVGSNFNAAKSAACIIFQDQIQTFKGVLRLLQININNGFQGACEYEVSVFGNLVGLNSALSGALLEDLDFSAYDHVYNDTNIVNSWDNPGGSGVYYPLIDYGTYSTNKHDWDIKTFRPALYVREYINKMITGAGYKWQSTLFDTPRFKSIVIPHSKKIMTVGLINLYAGDDTSKFYGTPPYRTNYGVGGATGTVPVIFGTLTGTGFTVNASPSPSRLWFTFNGLATTNVEIRMLFDITSTSTGGSSPGVGYIDVVKNGQFDSLGNITSGSIVYSGADSLFFEGGGRVVVGAGYVINVSMAPGDTLDFRLSQLPPVTQGTLSNVSFNSAHFDVKSAGGTSVPIPITIGDTVKLNDNIPQNIRQIDFLVGIVKLYNLYVYEDKFDEKLIYITPYIDFYSKNFSNAVDWTHKLNRNKVVKVKPMSELNAKIYKFKFKPDSDYFNELYRKRYNEGYGDRIYDSEFEFTQQTKEFEIIFSATPLVGFGAEDKVYPTILKRTGNEPNVTEENVDSNIRILQTKKITGVTPWNITTNAGATILNTLTRYGYAGHLDDPDIPTNDLNFGAPKELFFILSAGNLSSNQFNVYWSGYMREITDKDSKLVVANFYLTVKDILNLDFSKYIHVDGIAFRLNAIKDYDMSNPNDCVVELFKVNSASYSESSSNNGPPDGCYLLWSDEQTLDWDDAQPLLYGDCNTNPGDGEPPPITTKYVNWTFVRSTTSGSMKIYKNGILVSASSSTESGSFVVTVGDVIKTDVAAGLGKLKKLRVANDVDGVMVDTSSTALVQLSYTFTEEDKNYNIDGSVSNP
jgi:hypothetical protein